MNPFTQMATVLSRNSFAAWSPADLKDAKALNRTDSIRQLLKVAGRPVTAAEIAFDLDLPSSCTVWMLMKYDLQKGRVILEDGKYRWNHAYDTAESMAIRDAVKLLKLHGYKVKEPA